MTPKSPISTRVPGWLEDELRERWLRWGVGPSTGLRRICEEWWAREHLPAITFRDNVCGRETALEGGPEIWKVVLLEDQYREKERLQEHFGALLDEETLEAAEEFYRKLPEPVDERIAVHERSAGLVRRLGVPTSEPGDLLLGVELPVATAGRLRDRGVSARHVAEKDPPPASVRDQIRWGQQSDCILVTADYGEVGAALQGMGALGAAVVLLSEELPLTDSDLLTNAIAGWRERADAGQLSGWVSAPSD